MHRMRVAFVHKIVPVGVVAFLLLGAPLHLVAQEREAPAAERVSVIEWFSGVWGELTAWLVGGVVPQQPDQPTDNLDNGCAIDPHGSCRD
jgi:hypothetical protein